MVASVGPSAQSVERYGVSACTGYKTPSFETRRSSGLSNHCSWYTVIPILCHAAHWPTPRGQPHACRGLSGMGATSRAPPWGSRAKSVPLPNGQTNVPPLNMKSYSPAMVMYGRNDFSPPPQKKTWRSLDAYETFDGYGCGWWQAVSKRSQWGGPALRGCVRTLNISILTLQ